MKFSSHNVVLVVGLLIMLFQARLSYQQSQNVHGNYPLSEDAMITLLTFGKGKTIADVWGHTGIRVRDKSMGFDHVYNYGTYDFDQPGFLIKFLRGKLEYSLSRNDFESTFRYYTYYRRDIYEQELNLSYDEKLQLYNLLEENFRPENRYYLYDFFFDNCSTRPQLIIEKSLNGTMVMPEPEHPKTFRQFLDEEISDRRWLDLGIDLVIGSKADRIPDPRQRAFLPLNLKDDFSSAMITHEGLKRKLVVDEGFIAEFDPKSKNLPFFLHPAGVFTGLFILELAIFAFLFFSNRKIFLLYDRIWFFAAFSGGLLISFLWFFTDHQATKSNWNFAVLNPLYLLMYFRNKKVRYYSANLISIILFAFMICYAFLPQQFNPALIPLTGVLLLKTAKYGIFRKHFSL